MNDIEQILSDYAGSLTKDWGGHDRMDTCGASEVFGCIRKLWYEKHATPHDDDYEDRYGAKLRGNLIEDHFLVPAFDGFMPEGFTAVAVGADQATKADGFLSATPDGIVVNISEETREFCGVPVPPGECVLVEFKSIDPRVNLDAPKPVHAGQVQVQMGLIRGASNHQPTAAILVYVDASFLDDLTIFVVDWNAGVYDVAHDRAHSVFATKDPKDLSPEGAIAGGDDCKYCPWFARCRGHNIERIPNGAAVLPDAAMAKAEHMARDIKTMQDALKEQDKAIKERIEVSKKFLADHKTRRVKGDGWGLSWTSTAGRKTISKDLIEEAGLDPVDYMTEGQPGERFTVTAKQETEK